MHIERLLPRKLRFNDRIHELTVKKTRPAVAAPVVSNAETQERMNACLLVGSFHHDAMTIADCSTPTTDSVWIELV